MSQMMEIPTEDLPYWMRQARRGWDWGLLLVIIACLIATWPFMLQPGLPRTNASENYVFMASDFSDALREGRLYPRWSPNILGGYGAPIPNYYPPLPAYAAALVKILFTNDAVLSIRMIYILAYCLCGTSIYLLINRHTNAASGFLSAILFIFSPYFGQVAPHIRGDLPGMVGLALMSMLLWLVDRLLSINRPQDVLLVALISALLMLSKVHIALFAPVLVALLILYHIWSRRRRVNWLPVVISMSLGIVIAAFYWLPALIEQDFVQWRSRPQIAALQLTAQSLIAPFHPVDLVELVPSPQWTIGLVTMAFALVSAVVIVIVRKAVSFHVTFLIAGVVIAGLTVLIFPSETWLLGPITFCLAIGGSGALNLRDRMPVRWQRLFPVVLLTIVLLASSSVWLAPRWPESFGDVTPLQQIIYEQEGAGIAVLPPDAPLPATISSTLAANRFLISGYQSNNINKIAPAQANPGVEINVISHNTHSDIFQIGMDRQTRLNILTAYFPGWQAFAGDSPVPLRKNDQNGLMYVDAPSGNFDLRILLGETPARQNAWLISGAGLLLTLLITRHRFRQQPGDRDDPDLLNVPEVRLIAVMLGCFTVIILTFATPFSPLTLHARPGYALDNAISIRSRTDTGLEALAYRLEQTEYHPGDTLNFTLYWQAIRFLPDNYQTQVYLLDGANDTRWHRTDFRTPGGYPARRWRAYRYITDPYQIPLSESIIPGTYQIVVEVYTCSPTCEPGKYLSFFDTQGASLGHILTIPTRITIAR